ncbi:MAG: nitroreductase family protein [Clostridia bacterium]|nr:nitroreductase family protein [Clostridia bacterium]
MTTLEKLFTPAQRSRLFEAIPNRYSCRSFSGAPSTADWAALSYAAQRYALPGVRLFLHTVPENIFTGIVLNYGKITGCTTIAVLAASIAQPHSRIHAGILGEAFCLEATAMGLGTCWVAGTYKRKQLELPLQADETVLSIIAIGVPEKAAPDARKRKSLDRICKGDIRQWPEELRRAAAAVQMAPSALNLQPWEMAYTDGHFTLDAPQLHQLDLGIAVCHAELAVAEPHLWHFGDGKREPLACMTAKE